MNLFLDILTDLGLSGRICQNGKEMELKCPFHDDSTPSMYVSMDNGAWICHAGCGSGGFIELVDRLEAVGHRPKPAAKAHTSLLRRGITAEIAASWKICWNPDVGATEIPCHDPEGAFVGYIWRMPDGQVPKYRYPAGFPRSRLLFGLHRLHLDRQIFLAEGPMDAIWLQAAGLPGVALLGAFLSAGQMEILSKRLLREIILCFDNDKAGQLATEMATRQLRQEGFWVYRVELPPKFKDIQEVPIEKVPQVAGNRHLCTNGAGMLHPRYKRWLDKECAAGAGIWKLQ